MSPLATRGMARGMAPSGRAKIGAQGITAGHRGRPTILILRWKINLRVLAILGNVGSEMSLRRHFAKARSVAACFHQGDSVDLKSDSVGDVAGRTVLALLGAQEQHMLGRAPRGGLPGSRTHPVQ